MNIYSWHRVFQLKKRIYGGSVHHDPQPGPWRTGSPDIVKGPLDPNCEHTGFGCLASCLVSAWSECTIFSKKLIAFSKPWGEPLNFKQYCTIFFQLFFTEIAWKKAKSTDFLSGKPARNFWIQARTPPWAMAACSPFLAARNAWGGWTSGWLMVDNGRLRLINIG